MDIAVHCSGPLTLLIASHSDRVMRAAAVRTLSNLTLYGTCKPHLFARVPCPRLV